MHIFVHPLYETLWYAGFRTVFVLVVSSKLSWVRTFEVFVPQNGLNVLYPGPKQLWYMIVYFIYFSGCASTVVTGIVHEYSCDLMVAHVDVLETTL